MVIVDVGLADGRAVGEEVGHLGAVAAEDDLEGLLVDLLEDGVGRGHLVSRRGHKLPGGYCWILGKAVSILL